MKLVKELDELKRSKVQAPSARPRLELCPPHPISLAALDRFATGAASFAERQAVMLHLLTGCQDCGRRLQIFWSGDEDAAAEEDYDRALDRVVEQVWVTAEG